jgi:hypothetical protein
MQFSYKHLLPRLLECARLLATPNLSRQMLGVIDGSISDNSGALVASATVTIENNGTVSPFSTGVHCIHRAPNHFFL